MLATLVDQPFDSKDWVYETKWDGFRLVAEVRRDSVRLFSRNGIEVTARYPSIAQALRTIPGPCVIDGELVALDAKGRSRFQLLQNALRDESTELRYCACDILFLGGKDMRRKPLLERKALLKQVLPRNSLMRYSKHIKAKGTALFKKAKQAGLEGVEAGSRALLFRKAYAGVAQVQGDERTGGRHRGIYCPAALAQILRRPCTRGAHRFKLAVCRACGNGL